MEFIPAVALAMLLWSIVVVVMAMVLWLLFRLSQLVCHSMKLRVSIGQLLMYAGMVGVLGFFSWKGKQFLWPLVHTSEKAKLIVLGLVLFIAIFPVRSFRQRVDGWFVAVHDHITPLVYLFGSLLILSVPVVVYHAWIKGDDSSLVIKEVVSAVEGKEKPNIIFVTFDALSAKDMSTYGYFRQTTPFITEWSKKATIFKNLEADSNWTVPATASLMTGKRVWTHKAAYLQGAKPLKSDRESLPLVLKKNGYYNMAFVSNTLASVKALGIENSFDIAPLPVEFSAPQSMVGDGLNIIGVIDKVLYRHFADRIKLHDWILKEDFQLGRLLNLISRNISLTTTPPAKVFDRFFEALNNNPPEPYFAWIHVFPPHDPYLPPEKFKGIFDSSDEFRTYKGQDAVRLKSHKYLFKFQPYPDEMQPVMDLLRSYYDEFIRYCDREFEIFIKRLTAEKKLNNTIIILSSDHGESFENGYHTHGGPFLYESVTHVPLIMKEPGQKRGLNISIPVEQIDIPASILDLSGIAVPFWMEGRSLVPAIRGEAISPYPVFSMNLRMNQASEGELSDGSYAVREGSYKLIYIIDGERKWFSLFNLKNDPDELNNIYENEPEKGRYLLNLIYKQHENSNEEMGEE